MGAKHFKTAKTTNIPYLNTCRTEIDVMSQLEKDNLTVLWR